MLATTRAISPANTVECRIEDFSKTIGAPIYYLNNFPQKRLENEKKMFPVGVGVRGVMGSMRFLSINHCLGSANCPVSVFSDYNFAPENLVLFQSGLYNIIHSNLTPYPVLLDRCLVWRARTASSRES